MQLIQPKNERKAMKQAEMNAHLEIKICRISKYRENLKHKFQYEPFRFDGGGKLVVSYTTV